MPLNSLKALNKSVLNQYILCIISLFSVIFLTSCASKLTDVEDIPANYQLTGKWEFLSEEKDTFEEFRNRAEQATAIVTAELIRRGESKTAVENAQPNRMILDMLINLLSLPRQELYFRQTTSEFEIDYGVAGYHTFPIATQTEMLLAGAKFKAIAGWVDGEVVIHIVVTKSFSIYHRFRLLDDNILIDTMVIDLGADNQLSHERWYRRSKN